MKQDDKTKPGEGQDAAQNPEPVLGQINAPPSSGPPKTIPATCAECGKSYEAPLRHFADGTAEPLTICPNCGSGRAKVQVDWTDWRGYVFNPGG